MNSRAPVVVGYNRGGGGKGSERKKICFKVKGWPWKGGKKNTMLGVGFFFFWGWGGG